MKQILDDIMGPLTPARWLEHLSLNHPLDKDRLLKRVLPLEKTDKNKCFFKLIFSKIQWFKSIF